jgi:hypothetical protein
LITSEKLTTLSEFWTQKLTGFDIGYAVAPVTTSNDPLVAREESKFCSISSNFCLGTLPHRAIAHCEGSRLFAAIRHRPLGCGIPQKKTCKN